jgi:hypothetical protein
MALISSFQRHSPTMMNAVFSREVIAAGVMLSSPPGAQLAPRRSRGCRTRRRLARSSDVGVLSPHHRNPTGDETVVLARLQAPQIRSFAILPRPVTPHRPGHFSLKDGAPELSIASDFGPRTFPCQTFDPPPRLCNARPRR